MGELDLTSRALVEENLALRAQIATLREDLSKRGVVQSLGWIIVSALPVAALIGVGFARRWVTDDAFIDFRVVQQILAGHGPVFNVGQRVEVYTSPIWVALLAIFGGISGQIEISSVALGLLFSAVGLVTAELAALRIVQRIQSREVRPLVGMLIPLGAVVFLAVPAVWDFLTSGMETGLIFGWIGISYWLLTARLLTDENKQQGYGRFWGAIGWRRALTAIVIGLGPLVRPDLLLMSLAFLGALIVGSRFAPQTSGFGRDWLPLLILSGALPGIYQIFRMGYFASLVANTALAKEATAAYWSHGGLYFGDFFDTYVLWIPLIVLGAWWAAIFLESWVSRDRQVVVLFLTPVIAGLADSLFVIRVGGDFMHARFLLPGFFCALLPVLIVKLPVEGPRVRWASIAATILVLWGITCAFLLRVPYLNAISPGGIADERGFYTLNSHNPNPITASDYARDDFAADGTRIAALAISQHHALLTPSDAPPGLADRYVPLVATIPDDLHLAIGRDTIGLRGFNAGLDVFLIDRFGLADPIAGRLALRPERGGRPGHEKWLAWAWMIAEYAVPAPDLTSPEIAAAQAVLRCGDVRELEAAISEPLTFNRFVQNIRDSWQLTQLRVPEGPQDAQKRFC